MTGARSEYGLLRSLMEAIRTHPRLELQVVATGMHLLPQFGRTVDEIARDGFRIDARIPMQTGSDSPTDQALGLARGIAGMAEFFQRARSDIVLVLGDRIEAMAAALAAVTTGRVLAHVHGGDVAPGDFDDSLRHAITKLAHVHFAATSQSARRIVRMGEDPRRVHVVGAPGLDRLRQLTARVPARRARSGAALVVQHPCGRPATVEERITSKLLDAVAATGLRRIVICPNSDRGHRGIVRAIKRHADQHLDGEVEVHRSLPRDDYLRLLLRVDMLVGNSSSGLIEAPVAGTPVVNVGDRQRGREASGPGVIHVAETRTAILAGVRRALRRRMRPAGSGTFGDGRAGWRIAAILARLRITRELLRKQITC